MTHNLKIWGSFFNAVVNGNKTFEIRKLDRDFRVGDFLELNEFRAAEQEYTGRKCTALITYVYKNMEFVKEDYCILGIKLVSDLKLSHRIYESEQYFLGNERFHEFSQSYRNLDHQNQCDKFFRKHLMRELDIFHTKLNPGQRQSFDKIMTKLYAKERNDLQKNLPLDK